MADFRITELQVQTQLTEDSWVATDNTTTGYRRFNLKSVSDAASAANTAATAAMAAKTAADAAKASADAAAADAAEAAASAESRIDAAIDAIGDISELAVPLMSSDTRGGAKLGHGLKVSDGSLHVGALAEESTGAVLGPLASVDAKGWAEQDTTTGKNLLPNIATSRTINGVTFIKNQDGSYTLNGTASGKAELSVNSTPVVIADGTYTLSGTPSGGSSTTYFTSVWTNSANWTLKSEDYGQGASFNFSSEADVNLSIYITVRTGVTVSNLTFYTQLEAGSTATAYEPYTGGAPSPSPSYPQEIRVGKGRNLIDPSTFIAVSGGPDHVTSDGYVSDSTPSGDGRSWAYSSCNYQIDLDAGTYTLSFDVKIVGSSSSNGFAVYKSSGNQIASGGIAAATTFTLTDATRIGIMLKVFDYVVAPKLEIGSIPSPYVPYGHVRLEAQGKNLFNPDAYVNYAPEIYSVDNGSLTVKIQDATVWSLGSNRPKYYLKAGTYKISTDFPNNIQVYNITAASEITRGVDPSFTVAADSWVGIKFLPNGGYPYTAGRVQLEKGSTATAYEPYIPVTPIPLPSTGYAASLPDGTADELTIDPAGKVQWVQRVGKVVIDENTTVTNHNFTNNQCRVMFNVSQNLVPTSAGDTIDNTVISNYFYPSSNTKTNNGEVGIHRRANNSTNEIVLSWGKGRFGSVEAALEWLSTHPVTVYLKLATPITHDLGYISLPDIPGEATVSIKELSNLQLTFWVDSDGSLHAASKAWYERARSEYEDRLTSLEEAVATLVTGT